MIQLWDLRGVRCRNCGHDTRLFSPICGKCFRRKGFLQRLPIYLLPVATLLGVAALVAAAELVLPGG